MIFCTLSDKNYLANGIALCENINEKCREQHKLLFYLCLDNETFTQLNLVKKENPFLIPVQLETIKTYLPKQFKCLVQNHESRPIDTSDGQSSFHWAMAPLFTNYILNILNTQECMYIDSDIYFYQTPEDIFDVCRNHDVGLITHKHVRLEKMRRNVGYYNVGIIYFQNTTFGSACCRWWQDVVVDTNNPWYNPFGSCGDQKYLEIFKDIFPFLSIKIIDEAIGHSAPWNLGSSTIEDEYYIWPSNLVIPNTKYTKQKLYFHHFSHFTPDYKNNKWSHQRNNEWGNCVDTNSKTKLYEDYFARLKDIKGRYGI